jgi:hypothetical protein
MCPWRNPEADLAAFFPGATRYEREVKILSGRRLELQEKLGRPLAPEENSLYIYRVFDNAGAVGTVATRRVRGENGAIEIVLAANPDQTIGGLRLQRIREPQAAALEDPNWLGAFHGKCVRDSLRLGTDLPDLPVGARASGQAIVEGTHSLLVLLADAEELPGRKEQHH